MLALLGANRRRFRSDWAAEQTNYPREVAEAALAHGAADKVGRVSTRRAVRATIRSVHRRESVGLHAKY
jgi:hypothetical protein